LKIKSNLEKNTMINVENLNKIFNSAIINKKTSVTEEFVEVEGVTGLHKLRKKALNDNKQQIIDMLRELPDPFMEHTGGGRTFLNGCMTKDQQDIWTGLQSNVEQLLLLGLGIGKIKYTIQKEFWGILPGGVPYFMILGEPTKE